MADNATENSNTSGADNDAPAAATKEEESPRPVRRSGRNRQRNQTLVASFTHSINTLPANEVQELSDELHKALGNIVNGPNDDYGFNSGAQDQGQVVREGGAGIERRGGDFVSASCVGRVQYQPIDIAAATTLVPLNDASSERQIRRGESIPLDDNDTQTSARQIRANSQQLFASMSIDIEKSIARRSSGDEYYAPKSSSRRNSRAGSELAANMKLCAQQALAELGDVSDDENDEDLLIRGIVNGLEGVKEDESFRIVDPECLAG